MWRCACETSRQIVHAWWNQRTSLWARGGAITRVEHGDCSARYWSARVSPACVCAKDLTPGASAVGLPASPPPAGDHLRSRYAISNGSPI